MVFIILLYFIIALTFVFAKDAVFVASPIFFITIRMLIAGAVLFLLEYVKTKKIVLPKRQDIFFFSIVSLLHIFIPFVGEFWSLQYLDALKVNFLFALTPFFAVTIEAFQNKKFPSIRIVSGIIIGFCALMFLLIIKDQESVVINLQRLFSLSIVEFILLCAVISSTIAWFFIKQLTKEQYSITMINAWCMVTSGLFSLIMAYFFEDIKIINFFEFLKNLFLLILFSNVFFYNLYGTLIQTYSMTFLTASGFLSPFFGILLEAIMTQTVPDYLYFISLFLVAFGLYFIAYD